MKGRYCHDGWPKESLASKKGGLSPSVYNANVEIDPFKRKVGPRFTRQCQCLRDAAFDGALDLIARVAPCEA